MQADWGLMQLSAHLVPDADEEHSCKFLHDVQSTARHNMLLRSYMVILRQLLRWA